MAIYIFNNSSDLPHNESIALFDGLSETESKKEQAKLLENKIYQLNIQLLKDEHQFNIPEIKSSFISGIDINVAYLDTHQLKNLNALIDEISALIDDSHLEIHQMKERAVVIIEKNNKEYKTGLIKIKELLNQLHRYDLQIINLNKQIDEINTAFNGWNTRVNTYLNLSNPPDPYYRLQSKQTELKTKWVWGNFIDRIKVFGLINEHYHLFARNQSLLIKRSDAMERRDILIKNKMELDRLLSEYTQESDLLKKQIEENRNLRIKIIRQAISKVNSLELIHKNPVRSTAGNNSTNPDYPDSETKRLELSVIFSNDSLLSFGDKDSDSC
jgi:hypothetical protein